MVEGKTEEVVKNKRIEIHFESAVHRTSIEKRNVREERPWKQ